MVGSLAAASWMFWGRAFYAKLAPALEAMPINRVFLILFQQRDKYFVELLLIGLVLIFLINMVIGTHPILLLLFPNLPYSETPKPRPPLLSFVYICPNTTIFNFYLITTHLPTCRET